MTLERWAMFREVTRPDVPRCSIFMIVVDDVENFLNLEGCVEVETAHLSLAGVVP